MEGNAKKILSGVGFYGTLAVCLTVIGVCSWLLLRDTEEPVAAQVPVTPQVPVSQPVEMPEKTPEPAEEIPEPVIAEVPDVPAVDETPVIAEAPRLVVAPLRGEVLAAFSMEELTYNRTLGDWRTHDGVDIAAQTGTTVLAACAGSVAAVTEDPLLGTTVILTHSDGYTTTYANLQAQPGVSVGDTVSAGQIIGAVGSTAAAEDGAPHLHFAAAKDGKAVDPNEFLNS